MRTVWSKVNNLTATTPPTEMDGVCMVATTATYNANLKTADIAEVCSVNDGTKKAFKFKQDGAWTAKYLTVVSPTFEPNTKDAMGRFYFKPSFQSPATVWPGSIFEYTFGSHSFGSEATCQVRTGSTGPTGAMSDAVSICLISSSKIKVTLAKTISTVDFFVVINRASAWQGAGEVSGTVNAYSMADV